MDELLLRELTPAVIGGLVRRGVDFTTAEDAVQEALIQAALTWVDLALAEPQAWLVTVARRKFLGVYRCEASRRDREQRVRVEPPPGPIETVDDTLHLFFLCAHRSLMPVSAVALTLRVVVGGLTTGQIAQVYLVPKATMAQRISRAKCAVRDVRFEEPGDLTAVRRVLFLVFNEYGELFRLTESLVVQLNRAVAIGEADAPVAGLRTLATVGPGLPRYAAASAYRHEKAGDRSAAYPRGVQIDWSRCRFAR
jgi:predicted RNA polymerase sigma factor